MEASVEKCWNWLGQVANLNWIIDAGGSIPIFDILIDMKVVAKEMKIFLFI